MDDMKDSGIPWLGEINSEYRIIRIKYLCNLYSGDNITSQEIDVTGKYPVYGGNGLRGYCGKYTNDGIYILIGRQGALCGNVHLCNGKFWATDHAVVVYCNDRIDLMYFYYNLISLHLNQFSQSAAQPGLAVEKIRNIYTVVPNLNEQKRIADFLDEKCGEIDGIVAKIQQEMETLKQYKQSIISEAVTKGIRPNVPLKDSGIDYIGKIPENWRIIKIKYIATNLSKGNGITKEDIVVDGDMPCVRYGEIYSRYNYSFKNCLTKTNLTRISSPQYFSYGDVLFAGTGELVEEIGKCIVYLGNEECLAGGDIVLLKHKQNPTYLGYALNSRYIQIQKSMGKAKLKVVHISASNIGNIRLLLPPLEEQREIAAYLDQKCAAIDGIISSKEKQLQTLSSYKKSLIYEYVTGKKRVPKE